MELSETWLPKNVEDLAALAPENIVYRGPASRVVRTAPGVLIKYSGHELSEEVRCAEFALRHTSIPIPRVIHYPQHARVWYICMEEAPGISLDKTINSMSTLQLDEIASQLKDVLTQLQSVNSKSLGSVTGGPYRNQFFPEQVAPTHAFSNVGEFLDAYRDILMLFCTEVFTEALLSRFPRSSSIAFSHCDLLPRNIIVSGSTITAIVDWRTAGFYPDYWEYCRMNDPHSMTPNWAYVLKSIWPGPPRQTEIDAVHELTQIIWQTLL